MRLNNDKINEICKKLNTDRLNSWSRVNCVHNSLYEYYLKYILQKKEDHDDSIYKVTGGISHDILEKYYTNEIKYDEMIEQFEDGWMAAFDIGELKFVRSDENRNKSIANKYYYDLKNFFKSHEEIKDNITIEQFTIVKIGNEYYQGYIDALIKHTDNTYTILDWKTSSIYKGDKAKNESGQLVMYAISLNQKGIPYEKIKIAWNFLKYQSVIVQSKKGVKKTREIERCELGEKLQANAKMWLKEFDYTEDQIFEYLNKLVQTNDINVLPKEVKDKYEIHDCYVYINLTPELIEHWTNFIIDTMKEIRSKEEKYKELIIKGKDDEADKIWWEDEESVKKQSYYLSNLCGYSVNLHKPYKKYLEKLELEKNNNIFNTNIESQKNNVEEYAEDDLSWLNEL